MPGRISLRENSCVSVPSGVRMVDCQAVVVPRWDSSVRTSQRSVCCDTFKPAHVDRQRIVQSEQHADEDVGPELPLDFDDLKLERLEILGIDLGIELIEEMPLVDDEEGDGHAVGHLAAQDGQESFAGVHELVASG